MCKEVGALKKCLAFVLALLCLALSGCELWMDGSYTSVTPHREQYVGTQLETAEVSSYNQLRRVLSDMVDSGTQSGVIYTSELRESLVKKYMDMAVDYVRSSTPIGAYSLNELTYEIGTNAGRPAVAVEASYDHGRSELLRIKKAASMEEAVGLITEALKKCDASVVLRVAAFEALDFAQLVQDYVSDNPDLCMEQPQVSAAVYPESGDDRVVALNFAYQTSRESLRNMQEQVKPVFASAELYVSGDAQPRQKYSQLYSFLMERYDYMLETSITPSYSLLCHGVGDSRAFATVYAAMCRRSGLTCMVVSGTRAGEPRYWNIVSVDDVHYHVDLLQPGSSIRLRSDSQMSGYVWDYSAYPACG